MKQYQLSNSPIVYYISEKKDAPWILFLHAAFVNHHMFHTQIACFQAKYNVLTLDIIGHGQSIKTHKGDSIDHMAKWINEIMEKEGIDRIHIVGVSLGAILAQDFANQFSEKVLSLACFGGYDINNFDPQLQQENNTAQKLMMLKAMISVPWFAKANKKISAYTKTAQDAFYEMNCTFQKKSFRYLASLNSLINVHQATPRGYPLLIGCGQHDIPSELSAIAMWKKSEPDCETVIFTEAGHCVNMDVPRQFNQVLEQFWTSKA